MHISQLQGETAQLGNAKQRRTFMMSVWHNYSSTAATERLDGRGDAINHTKVKVDRSDASLKKTARCTLPTTI